MVSNPSNETPNLSRGTEIVAENLRAVQIIYIAAMLEELKVFQVVDRLVDLFQHGLLTVDRKSTGRTLYKYWRETPLRLSQAERRNLFSSSLGIPGGSDAAKVNREFNDLWLRFIYSVSALKSQTSLTNLESTDKTAADELSLRRAATDLARNLSLHGSGMTLFAATDVQNQIETSMKLLSDPEIRSAYGARDAWQVIDQVATIDLGGAANANRLRTMATTGSTIISWLAGNVSKLTRATTQRPFIRVKTTSVPPLLKEFQFSAKPSDSELLNACEKWLAVNGVSDDQIEQQSQSTATARGTAGT